MVSIWIRSLTAENPSAGEMATFQVIVDHFPKDEEKLAEQAARLPAFKNVEAQQSHEVPLTAPDHASMYSHTNPPWLVAMEARRRFRMLVPEMLSDPIRMNRRSVGKQSN